MTRHQAGELTPLTNHPSTEDLPRGLQMEVHPVDATEGVRFSHDELVFPGTRAPWRRGVVAPGLKMGISHTVPKRWIVGLIKVRELGIAINQSVCARLDKHSVFSSCK